MALIGQTRQSRRKELGKVQNFAVNKEIHEDYNDLIPFILETKHDPRTKRLGNYSKARALLLISTSQIASHNQDSATLKRMFTKTTLPNYNLSYKTWIYKNILETIAHNAIH